MNSPYFHLDPPPPHPLFAVSTLQSLANSPVAFNSLTGSRPLNKGSALGQGSLTHGAMEDGDTAEEVHGFEVGQGSEEVHGFEVG